MYHLVVHLVERYTHQSPMEGNPLRKCTLQTEGSCMGLTSPSNATLVMQIEQSLPSLCTLQITKFSTEIVGWCAHKNCTHTKNLQMFFVNETLLHGPLCSSNYCHKNNSAPVVLCLIWKCIMHYNLQYVYVCVCTFCDPFKILVNQHLHQSLIKLFQVVRSTMTLINFEIV